MSEILTSDQMRALEAVPSPRNRDKMGMRTTPFGDIISIASRD